MGAAISVQNYNKSPEDIKNILNKIFVDFIKTSNFSDFTKFHLDPKVREQITIITNEAIESNLNLKDIEYISHELYGDNIETSVKKTDRVIVLKNSDINKLDVSDKKHKKDLAAGIAKYYIKIYSIFAAIMVTVHPEFNEDNKSAETNLFSTAKNKLSLCSRRINALTNNEKDVHDLKGNITIQPKKNICEFSLQDKFKSKSGSQKGYIRKLSDEIGIKELQQLYFDIFDPKSGTYNDMTPGAKKKYQKAVQTFYKTYTGNSDIPSSAIDSFDKIPLKDFHNSTNCNDDNSVEQKHKYPDKLYGNINSDTLFKQYADTVNDMINYTNMGLNKLLSVIDVIFKIIIDNSTGEKEIVVNSNITMPVLNKITDDVIEILMDLYTKCEDNFQKGVDIINSIVAIDKFNRDVTQEATSKDITEKILTGKMEEDTSQFDVPTNPSKDDSNPEDDNDDDKEDDDDDDDDDDPNIKPMPDKIEDNSIPENPDLTPPKTSHNLAKELKDLEKVQIASPQEQFVSPVAGGGNKNYYEPFGEFIELITN